MLFNHHSEQVAALGVGMIKETRDIFDTNNMAEPTNKQKRGLDNAIDIQHMDAG